MPKQKEKTITVTEAIITVKQARKYGFRHLFSKQSSGIKTVVHGKNEGKPTTIKGVVTVEESLVKLQKRGKKTINIRYGDISSIIVTSALAETIKKAI